MRGEAMLSRVESKKVIKAQSVRIADASFPSPFSGGLEYAAPARGTWNIVHTGFLLPEAHEIFVCAQGCLRGVVLTAAEMGAQERFSTISVCEQNILDGDMEQLIIDGVADILDKLPYRPRAVLLYTSCVHHFIGCDLPFVYRTLRANFPDIDFADCYMNPIMRKSGMTPDQLMRSRLYSLLKPCPQNPKAVNIIGNDLTTDKNSELLGLLAENGFTVREITACKTYAAYQKMAEGTWNIVYQPAAKAAGTALEKRLGQKLLYLPLSFDYEELKENYRCLCTALHIPHGDFSEEINACEKALAHLKTVLGETPVSIDYTATFRPLGLALLLLEHKVNVVSVYADAFTEEEKAAFSKLCAENGNLQIIATTDVKMRFAKRNCPEKTVAIGQKAAYFTGTRHFVNIVECGGLYGFYGIQALCRLIEDACLYEKDTKSLIQIKGMG